MKNPPSPALVISIIALFVALSGTSYAAVKLSGKNIKKGTVSGTALKKNTLGGAQIKESRLGKVPSAAIADKALSADSAGSAATLAGIAPGSLVKGNANVITRNATFAASTGGIILRIPGLGRLIGNCNATNDIQLEFKSEASQVSVRLSSSASSSILTTGGSWNNESGFGTSFSPSQKFQATVWRSSTPDVAYEINGATSSCNTSAVAVGNG